jgi:hypothetical protein
MQPWIIEKIKNEQNLREEEMRIQPHLPAPEPMWEHPPVEQTPDRGTAIVDFEIIT